MMASDIVDEYELPHNDILYPPHGHRMYYYFQASQNHKCQLISTVLLVLGNTIAVITLSSST